VLENAGCDRAWGGERQKLGRLQRSRQQGLRKSRNQNVCIADLNKNTNFILKTNWQNHGRHKATRKGRSFSDGGRRTGEGSGANTEYAFSQTFMILRLRFLFMSSESFDIQRARGGPTHQTREEEGPRPEPGPFSATIAPEGPI